MAGTTWETEPVEIAVGESAVPALWRGGPGATATFAVAHGAGNDMTHPLLEGVADGLAGRRVASLRFDFPFAAGERHRPPDRPAVLLETWRAALREAAARGGGLPVVASGKSLGGRMASMLAADDPEGFGAAGLVFFGYPLHAPGRADRPRSEHLYLIRVPMLFIQGTRDPFCRFDLLESLLVKLGPRAALYPVAGGDHSFRVRGSKRPDLEIGRELGAVAAGFPAGTGA